MTPSSVDSNPPHPLPAYHEPPLEQGVLSYFVCVPAFSLPLFCEASHRLALQPFSNGQDPESSALGVMRNLLNSNTATWISNHQRDAVLQAMACKNDLIVVLPTGGGKTMIPIIPACLEACELTVIIVPLRSLLQDYVC